MKANAITRIIIWSLVIVLLVGILIAGLVPRYSHSSVIKASLNATEPTVALDSSSGIPAPTAAPDSPSSVSPAPSAVPAGVNAVPAEDISALEINWAAGNIVIESADVDSITFSESGLSKNSKPFIWKIKKEKLVIDFSEATVLSGFGIHVDFGKDLLIQVPKDWVCRELELDAASAALEVTGLTIHEVDIDTASGTCLFDSCNVSSMDVDTASGDIEFYGTLDSLECDAASASFRGVFTNVPRSIEMESASGDLDLTLPQDAGFSVKTDGLSSDFSSDFDVTQRNGNYIHGDGACRIEMDAMSGDVTIRKAQ